MRTLTAFVLLLVLAGCGNLPFFADDGRERDPLERIGVGKKKYVGYQATVYRRGQSRGWSDGFDGIKNNYENYPHLYADHNESAFEAGYKAGYKAGREAAKE